MSRIAVRDALLVAALATFGVAALLCVALALIGWQIDWPLMAGLSVACFVMNACLNLWRLRRLP